MAGLDPAIQLDVQPRALPSPLAGEGGAKRRMREMPRARRPWPTPRPLPDPLPQGEREAAIDHLWLRTNENIRRDPDLSANTAASSTRHRRGSDPGAGSPQKVRQSLADAIGLSGRGDLQSPALDLVRNRPAQLSHCRPCSAFGRGLQFLPTADRSFCHRDHGIRTHQGPERLPAHRSPPADHSS